MNPSLLSAEPVNESLESMESGYQESLQRFSVYDLFKNTDFAQSSKMPILRWKDIICYESEKKEAEKKYNRRLKKQKKKKVGKKKKASGNSKNTSGKSEEASSTDSFSFPKLADYLQSKEESPDLKEDFAYEQCARAWMLTPLVPDALEVLFKKYEGDPETIQMLENCFNRFSSFIEVYNDVPVGENPDTSGLSFVAFFEDPLRSELTKHTLSDGAIFQRFSKMKRAAIAIGARPDLSANAALVLFWGSVFSSDNRDFLHMYSMFFNSYSALKDSEREYVQEALKEMLTEEALIPEFQYEEEDLGLFSGYYETEEKQLSTLKRGAYLHEGIRRRGYTGDLEARAKNVERFRAALFQEKSLRRLFQLHGLSEDVLQGVLEALDDWFSGKDDYARGFPSALRGQMNAAFSMMKLYYDRSLVFSEEFVDIAHKELCRNLTLQELKKVITIWKTHMANTQQLESWAQEIFPDQQHSLGKVLEAVSVIKMANRISFSFPTDQVFRMTNDLFEQSPFKNHIHEQNLSSLYLGLCTEIFHVWLKSGVAAIEPLKLKSSLSGLPMRTETQEVVDRFSAVLTSLIAGENASVKMKNKITSHVKAVSRAVVKYLATLKERDQRLQAQQIVQVRTVSIPYKSLADEAIYQKDLEQSVMKVRLSLRYRLMGLFEDRLYDFQMDSEDGLEPSEQEDLQENHPEAILVGRLVNFLERYQEEREIAQLQYAFYLAERSQSDYVLREVFPKIRQFVDSLEVQEDCYEYEYGDDQMFENLRSVELSLNPEEDDSGEETSFDAVLEGDEDLLENLLESLKTYHEELLGLAVPIDFSGDVSVGSVEDFETLAPAFDLHTLIENQEKAFSTMTPESVIAFMNREFLRSLVGANRLPDQNQVNRLKVALQWENDGLNGKE